MDSVILKEWLADLAAKQPTPGGGGVAALHAATAAALLGMVTIYTTGAKWADREAEMKKLHEEVAELRHQALDLIDADAQAFAGVGEAYKLPKATYDEKQIRTEAIQKALIAAAEPPCQVVKLTTRLVEIAQKIAKTGNPNVISDVAVAAHTAQAALQSAVVNIVINQVWINDPEAELKLSKVVAAAKKQIAIAAKVGANVHAKIKAS